MAAPKKNTSGNKPSKKPSGKVKKETPEVNSEEWDEAHQSTLEQVLQAQAEAEKAVADAIKGMNQES